jgi:XTP/dITP diphosphohydrolase
MMHRPAQRVVLATGNAGKIREMQQVLAGTGLEVVPQSDFGVPEAEETGLTFIENALIKARNAAAHTGLPAIADDSGLEVYALNGAPGIYSSRYAGEEASAEANIAKLLQAMKGVIDRDRGACFRTSMVFMRYADDPAPIIAEGSWEGRILHAPRGQGGFGYDPIFFVPTHNASAAELSSEEKNRVSHRGQALAALRRHLLGARAF